MSTPFFVFERQNVGFEIPSYLVDEAELARIRPPSTVSTLQQRLDELTPQAREAFETLKEQVQSQDWFKAELYDDRTLIRYLIARNYNIAKSTAMLQKTAAWHESSGSLQWQCEMCKEDPNQHMMQFVGWDLQHRPVLYNSMRWSPDRVDPQRSLKHTVQAFNHAISLMPEGVEQWISVTDFVTYSHFKDGNPKMGSTVISTMQDHFPERLAMKILVDPPTMFWVLWKLFGPFIDAKTKEKVKFMYTKGKPNIRDEFPKIFPPHLSDYLIRSYERNKTGECASSLQQDEPVANDNVTTQDEPSS